VEAEAVKFLWKQKHFEERSWKRKLEAEVNSEATYTELEVEAKIFYCFQIPALNFSQYGWN